MKLLLIEDDVRVAQVLADAFEADGHETAIRHTGEDGLAYLTSERPDAVVLDVRLPTMNGVAVLRRIRSTDPRLDRKSTRLNSSHGYISYAVFCLKKKKNSTLALRCVP